MEPPEEPRMRIRPEDIGAEEAHQVLAFLNAAKKPQELADAIEIPGRRDVGVSIARSILDRRNQLGEFRSLSEVTDVPQIGPVRFSQIVTVLRQRFRRGGKSGMERLHRERRPRSPVEKERAMHHALLGIRRAWAGAVPDFEGWGAIELDPDPLVIHDLNGQELFYEYGVMDGNELVGSVKASASKAIGSAVPTIEFGPRGWDPGEATRAAEGQIKKRYPKSKLLNSELVCYSYPKIGIRVDMDDPEMGTRSIIFDASDFSMVERTGADELEGQTSWSFYDNVVGPDPSAAERRWSLSDEELEAARTKTPNVLARGFTLRELPRLKSTFVVESPYIYIPLYSSKVIKYAPRCTPHDCFALYAQKTNVYCAVATGQMILDFYRYHCSQDDIATAMGTGAGGTTNTGQVQGYESISNNCLDATYDNTANWSEAKAEIDANRPLKSGIPGHARACAGWKRQNIFLIGQQPKRWLRIYDPWPWNADICQGGKIVWEDWDAVTHTNFIYIRHRSTPCS
jgi:hypothetical protein